jgi:hypothetical protein
MSLSSSESENPVHERPQTRPSLGKNETLQGALRGLVPLGLLGAIVAIVFALTVLLRQLFAGSGFFVQQQATVITLFIGLVLAILVYGIAIFFTLRRLATWQQTGAAAQAGAALWALGVTVTVNGKDAFDKRDGWPTLAASSPIPAWVRFSIVGQLPPR